MARIRHLAILPENVEKLVGFYTTAFGLKVASRDLISADRLR